LIPYTVVSSRLHVRKGFSNAQVPDFLATLEDDRGIELLGQQELGPPEVAAAV
jgi:hypothetical protein